MPETVQQSKSVAALIAILSEDLPVCSWIVFPDDGLEGWIVSPDDDPSFDPIEAIHVWAKKFGTGVSKTGRVLITYGTSGHVPVRILSKDVYR
jgi:hypothetical protein